MALSLGRSIALFARRGAEQVNGGRWALQMNNDGGESEAGLCGIPQARSGGFSKMKSSAGHGEIHQKSDFRYVRDDHKFAGPRGAGPRGVEPAWRYLHSIGPAQPDTPSTGERLPMSFQGLTTELVGAMGDLGDQIVPV